MLGIAKKAGKLASGEFLVEESIRGGKAKVVIVSEEASANTKKRFRDKTTFYQVPLYERFDMATLGKAIGSETRAVISINDAGIARTIINYFTTDQQ
ncbi:MAG: ribosomal L7Ae/L30e/S12e/Gadd45 family protein [Lachnospiraceae bacterium]|nr:ribosomal L7Ae/L30e/S12e/Gadd45 family protein [Lachnospiraceae bacterium]